MMCNLGDSHAAKTGINPRRRSCLLLNARRRPEELVIGQHSCARTRQRGAVSTEVLRILRDERRCDRARSFRAKEERRVFGRVLDELEHLLKDGVGFSFPGAITDADNVEVSSSGRRVKV